MKSSLLFASIACSLPSFCAQQKPDVVFKGVGVRHDMEVGAQMSQAIEQLADALKKIKLLDAKHLAEAIAACKLDQILIPLAEALPKIKLVDTQPLQQAIKDIADAVKQAKPIDIDSFSKAVSALAQKLSEALPNVQLFKTEPLALALQEAAKSLSAALQNARIAVDPNKINADVTHKIDLHVTPQAQQAVRELSTRAAGCLGCYAALCTPTTPCQCCCLMGASGALLLAPMETINDCTQTSIELLKDSLRMCLPASLQARIARIARPSSNQPVTPTVRDLPLSSDSDPGMAPQSTIKPLSLDRLGNQTTPGTLSILPLSTSMERKKGD